ncbi:SDR family oxidoreductase [Aliidiomarina celeris]|uniref:SDR family oxidoreductase n=1 Tax=Aliidiomarina celeris TaxID=2249428 RepID=UPI000DEA74B7|nr:SDR family oxidoreductase [Aliidiomarina celeris]
MSSSTKSIFISGAGAGIGRATALLFLRQGWRVGAYDMNSASLASLQQEAQSNLLITGTLNVTEPKQWQQALADFTQHTGGTLNVLFNNAGILHSGPFETIALEAQQQTLAVNVEGVLNGCHSAFQYLKNTPNAAVINMSSASAIYGQPSLASYSASKFAVRALTEALSIEWQNHDIRVMDAMPLFVNTAMVTDMNAASIRRFGVRLTPRHIAPVIYRMAQHRGYKVHWPIGLQTKLLMFMSKLTPNALLRLTNRWIAR